MKKNKKKVEMEPKVKVSLKIMPFGSISSEFISSELPIEEKGSEMPRYIEPLTTNVEKVEIRYESGDSYLVPKTTAGI